MMRLALMGACLLFTVANAETSEVIDECLTRGYEEYPLHEIHDSVDTSGGLPGIDGQVLIDDEYGERTLKVRRIAWNRCPDWTTYRTASATPGGLGLTTVSMDAITGAHGQDDDGTNGNCRINNATRAGQQSHWWPIQGIHVEAVGWRIQPQNMLVSDVDMEGHTDNVDLTMRKGALVFGYRDGDVLVNATWTFPPDSELIEHTSMIQFPSLTNPPNNPYPISTTTPWDNSNLYGFGFTRTADTHVWLKGIQTTYGEAPTQPDKPLTCALGVRDTRCGAYFSFDQPVDGFFVLVNQEWKSIYQTAGLISVDPLRIPCGCRCKRADASGVQRTVTVPSTTTGMCTRKMIADDQFVCSAQGEMWCSRKTYDRYVITSSEPTNDLWPCTKSTGVKVTLERVFGRPTLPLGTASPNPTPSSSPGP